MEKKLFIMFSIMLFMVFDMTICFADNPVIQTNFTADPAPMVYDGKVYLYAGIDEDNAPDTGFLMRKWKCYSTADMVNWQDLGVSLPTSQISWSTGDANAGQCIYRNGKFYWYFPTGCKTDPGCAIGVAVSNSPAGPFVDIGHPLIYGSQMKAATHGWQGLDPTVFIDDDGQAYLYWGNNVCYWVKLNSDMISYSGSINNIPLTTAAFGPDFEEAPWLYKRNGLWYMAYSSSLPEYLAYTTSTSPTGPWTYRGVIMPIISGNGGNHSGIIDYKGSSYLFYFKNGLPGGGDHRRSVCVEKFTYNADGTIPKVPATTEGPPQVGNLNPYVTTEAETICWESGIETEVCSEGGIDVCNIENGDYIKVKGVDFGSGATSFDARVASASSGGNIEICLDSPTGKLVGTCAVSGTGSWQTWVTKTCSISGASGVHDLYFKFTGGSGSLFNFNWWKFYGSTPDPRSAYTQLEAESFNTQSGVQTESCTEGGEDVGYIENGDYAVYNNIDFGSGPKSFQVRVASGSSGGNIEIRLDSINGPLVGTCSVAGTGGWQTWTTTACKVSGVSGKHNLYLKFTGDSGYLLNINWFKFTSGSVNPTPAGDLNGDASVDAADYAMMKMYILGSIKDFPVEDDLAVGDINQDSIIDSLDLVVFKKYLLGDIPKLPYTL